MANKEKKKVKKVVFDPTRPQDFGHNDRLAYYVKTHYKKQKDFAEKIGMNVPNLGHYLRGRNLNLGLEKVILIRHFCPDLNLDWWFEGKGNMIIPPEQPLSHRGFANVQFERNARNLKDLQTAKRVLEYFINEIES